MAYQIQPSLLKFIHDYSKEIDENRFEYIYSLISYGHYDFEIYDFTNLLYASGIDPLPYMRIIPDNFATYSEIVYRTLPSNIEQIGDEAFRSNLRLDKIVFSNKLIAIGENAFRYCKQLQEIILPDTVTYIGKSAFANCENVTNLHISNGLDVIPKYAFDGLKQLKIIDIPDNIVRINPYAFYRCSSIEEINFGKGIKEIGVRAFGVMGDDVIKLKRINYNGTIEEWKKIDCNVNFGIPINCIDGEYSQFY